jgi:AcrR family transcriptional regulator
VPRSTIYRHFGSREELVGVVGRRSRETSDANQSDALRPPGERRADRRRWMSLTC